jgi:hypothetical protein
MENMPLLMDSGCNILKTSFNTIGSYKASNATTIIGEIVGSTFIVVGLLCCICCLCRRNKHAIKAKQLKLSNQTTQTVETYSYVPPIQYPLNITNDIQNNVNIPTETNTFKQQLHFPKPNYTHDYSTQPLQFYSYDVSSYHNYTPPQPSAPPS